MARCQICGKGRVTGNNVSHANNKTKRQVFPNIQRKKVVIDGRAQRANICTRCLRTGLALKAL